MARFLERLMGGRHWARRLAWRRARHLWGYLRQLAESMCLRLSAMADRCRGSVSRPLATIAGIVFQPDTKSCRPTTAKSQPTRVALHRSVRRSREAAEIASYHCVSCLG